MTRTIESVLNAADPAPGRSLFSPEDPIPLVPGCDSRIDAERQFGIIRDLESEFARLTTKQRARIPPPPGDLCASGYVYSPKVRRTWRNRHDYWHFISVCSARSRASLVHGAAIAVADPFRQPPGAGLYGLGIICGARTEMRGCFFPGDEAHHAVLICRHETLGSWRADLEFDSRWRSRPRHPDFQFFSVDWRLQCRIVRDNGDTIEARTGSRWTHAECTFSNAARGELLLGVIADWREVAWNWVRLLTLQWWRLRSTTRLVRLDRGPLDPPEDDVTIAAITTMWVRTIFRTPPENDTD